MPQFVFDALVDPGLADVMVAAGMSSPGVCTLISGGAREYNWDIKQAPGVQGYRMTYRGWKAGDEIVCRFTFFEHPRGPGYATQQSQIQSWYEDWIPIWAIDARKLRPTPVATSYPQLAGNDILNLVCKRIGPLQTDGHMNWFAEMAFLEYRPPIIIPTATPTGATARLGVPTPKDRIDVEIEKEKALAGRPL